MLERLLGGAKVTVEPMDLARDYAEIDRLFLAEQWPFLRSDLEVSHAQPGAVAFVARRAGAFAGFFATHPFGRVAYLDMMIVAPEFRRSGACRALYVATMRALRSAGLRAAVVHTTNDSAPLIRFLGFRAGARFTLLRREPTSTRAGTLTRATRLHSDRRLQLIAQDAIAFGCARPDWIDALLAQPETPFLGLERSGTLAAALALRPRREGAFSIDSASAASEEDLLSLTDDVLDAYADRRLECFVRTDGPLDAHLRSRGFAVPDFFHAIGPLVEWRKGATAGIGDAPRLQTLNWF